MSENQTPVVPNTLTDEEVIKAYRDPEFRNTLTTAQVIFAMNSPLAPEDAVPAELELSDEDLDLVAGGLASIGSVCSLCSVCSVCTLCSLCDILDAAQV